jgi:hypothetical protein
MAQVYMSGTFMAHTAYKDRQINRRTSSYPSLTLSRHGPRSYALSPNYHAMTLVLTLFPIPSDSAAALRNSNPLS